MKNKMKNIQLTQRNFLKGLGLIGIFSGLACNKKEPLWNNLSFPKPQRNQRLIRHLDGYTLLTDLDYTNGDTFECDVAEEKYVGGTPGNYSHKFYFRKGITHGQFLEGIEFVEPKFFEKYK